MARVEPIRDQRKIQDIKTLLRHQTRDYALFTCGVNNGLRGGDLLSLKVGQVKNKKIGDTIEIKEQKTGKINYFYLNKSCYKSIQTLIKEYELSNDDYLFPSRKEKGKLDTFTLNRLVKKWCNQVGLEGNFGSHTLRKTWGYIQRTKYGVSWEIIAKRYNHSNPSQTRVYLGISDKEVSDVMCNEI